MRFPNGFDGVKKLWLAELLGIIGSILVLISSGVMVGGLAAGSGNAFAGGLFATLGSGLVTGILAIISYILMVLGINAAKKDEPGTTNFSTALICVIVALAVSVLSSFISGTIGTILGIIGKIATIGITFFVIKGIQSFANAMGDAATSKLGNTVMMLFICAQVVAIILSIIGGSDAFSVIFWTMSLISTILSIVAYIMYLVYLNKAKKMLAA